MSYTVTVKTGKGKSAKVEKTTYKTFRSAQAYLRKLPVDAQVTVVDDSDGEEVEP